MLAEISTLKISKFKFGFKSPSPRENGPVSHSKNMYVFTVEHSLQVLWHLIVSNVALQHHSCTLRQDRLSVSSLTSVSAIELRYEKAKKAICIPHRWELLSSPLRILSREENMWGNTTMGRGQSWPNLILVLSTLSFPGISQAFTLQNAIAPWSNGKLWKSDVGEKKWKNRWMTPVWLSQCGLALSFRKLEGLMFPST